jgi:hypothetical protein
MKRLHFALLTLLSLGFSVAYLSSAYLLPQSEVSFHARLMTTSPFVYRLLIPFTLGKLLPLGWLDAGWLKMVFATGSVLGWMWLMPAFAQRVTGWRPAGWRLGLLWLACLAMLVAHYIVPRPYMFYYIYDLPAVPLYMACFLLLTRSHQGVGWPALLLLWVAFLNRETVVIAIFHALAFHLAAQPGNWRARWQALGGFVRPMLGVLVVMVLTRVALKAWIQPQGDGNVALMEGEYVRIYASVYRIWHIGFHAQALLLFGCGALLWMPLAYRRLPDGVKALVRGSTLPLLLLLVAGNIVELRIYGEFLPLLALAACLLAMRVMRREPPELA